jgi:hypothetical protein
MNESEEYSLDFLIEKFERHSKEYENFYSNADYFNLSKALKLICIKIKEHDERK